MVFVIGMNRDELWGLMPSGGKIAEVGVARGEHASVLYNAMKPNELVLIDAWKHIDDPLYDYDGANVDDLTMEDAYQFVVQKFQFVEQAKIERGLSGEIASKYPDGHFDMIYIDGNHTYQGCLADLETWGYKVNEHGLLCGHDFSNHSGSMAGRFGVVAAVEDYCRLTNWRPLCLTLEAQPSYVLARIDSAGGEYLRKQIEDWPGFKIELSSIFPFIQRIRKVGNPQLEEFCVWPRIGI